METAKKTEIKERIAAAAFELFYQKGVKSVSMDDIALHLSMSKKTIYKWFDNKDQIVFAATSSYLAGVEADCECHATEASNAIEELFNVMEMTRRVFSHIHPSIFHDLQKYHPSSWGLWLEHRKKYILDRIKLNLYRGIQEGLFRQDLDVEIVGRLRLAQIEMPFDGRLFPPHQFEIKKVQMASLELYMLGIATLKGHKLINEYKHVSEEE